LHSFVFERYEIKYLITKEQYDSISEIIAQNMEEDSHGRSTIQSLYFDTNKSLLIRQSIDKPTYKEKLRLRSYGVATKNSDVFLEIKKKYKQKVYKRRIVMNENNAHIFMNQYNPKTDTQIAKEISYMKLLYKDLEPRILLIYDRCAYSSNDLRITFDTNVRYRLNDLSLSKGLYGEKILDDNRILMEIKTSSTIPFWLARLLSDNKIYKTSFSKYKEAYQKLLMEEDDNEFVRINI